MLPPTLTASDVERLLMEMPDLGDDLVDPVAALESLASEIGTGPGSAEQRAMVDELRVALKSVGL